MRRLLIGLALVLCCSQAFAQFDFSPSGASSAALGGCFSASYGFWDATQTPAALPRLTDPAFGLSCRQNYMLRQLSSLYLNVAVPTKRSGAWGANLAYMGNTNYSEYRLSAAYGLLLSNTLSMGVSFHLLGTQFGDSYYPSQHFFTFSAALQYFPSDRLSVGFYLFNSTFTTISSSVDMKVPVSVSAGCRYQLATDFFFLADVEKNIYHPVNLHFGLEYFFQQLVYARLGCSSNPASFAFGLGVRQPHYLVDLAVEDNPVLGLSPQLSVAYIF